MDEKQAELSSETNAPTPPTSADAAQAPTAAGPARMMSRQMGSYYCNCAIAATSPKDISLFLGKLVRMPDQQGTPRLVELFERQVDMTVEQAEEIISVLTQTVEVFKARKGSAG